MGPVHRATAQRRLIALLCKMHLKELGVPTMVYYPKPMHEQGAFEGTCVVAPGRLLSH